MLETDTSVRFARVTLRRPPNEVLAVGAAFLAVAVAIVVTYARVPARELYHVSGSGFDAGLGRALVFLNFSTALVAICVAAICLRFVPRAFVPVGLVAIGLCAVVAWPGVVDQADLDAKWINVLPAFGVALVVALALVANVPRAPARVRGDRLRVALAVLATLVSAPWLAAELGFYLDGRHAVHHGHHHGTDGFLLTLSALALSRLLPAVRFRAAELYLAPMLAYGLANLANDAWGEQLVARGWTSRRFPNLLQPHASWAWLGLLVGAFLLWRVWFRQREDDTSAYMGTRRPRWVTTLRS